ncbi:Uma2 family endonuclease [Synechocystis sp. PCC 7338]|uniref:Uma2 family endonuclease n=1 Tax=Synechocystis sp. PCC 7338 TaxID=2732530 RepID=UPI001BAF2059|nr:Uma2 family endonuclease [Synechocystis sp. PCC 7338]QUS60389.1 Uma2 family endonuclease [Synechocystis sp. PCC 7338]
MVPTLDRQQLVSLNLPDQVSLQVTPEQFTQLAIANRDLRLERTATGALIVNPPTGSESGNRNARIITQLGVWSEANENLGEIFDSSAGFKLPNGANRSPDASWVARQRWDALTPAERKTFAPLCPDFVVELRSATDTIKDLREKMEEYMENGAKLGWLIDPQNRRVEIYRPRQAVEVLQNPDTLSGEAVLPGFTLSLKRIFPI